MGWIRLGLIVCVLFAGYKWWAVRTAPDLIAEARDNPNGFISVAMPSNAKAGTVVIFAPVNCPSEVAQRANALAADLTAQGIPNVRSSSYSLSMTDPTKEQQAAAKRAVAVMDGDAPAVFINGMGKANPTIDEVIAEYRRTL